MKRADGTYGGVSPICTLATAYQRLGLSLRAGRTPRLVIGADAEGITALQLKSPTRVALQLLAHPEGPLLDFLDKAGKSMGRTGIDFHRLVLRGEN